MRKVCPRGTAGAEEPLLRPIHRRPQRFAPDDSTATPTDEHFLFWSFEKFVPAQQWRKKKVSRVERQEVIYLQGEW